MRKASHVILVKWLLFLGTLPSTSQNRTGFKGKPKERKDIDVDGRDPENEENKITREKF